MRRQPRAFSCVSRGAPLYAHETSNASAAGVETMKLVCTPTRAEAGPSNNWMAPRAARLKLELLLAGSLRSSTLYVVPHVRPGYDNAPPRSRLNIALPEPASPRPPPTRVTPQPSRSVRAPPSKSGGLGENDTPDNAPGGCHATHVGHARSRPSSHRAQAPLSPRGSTCAGS